MSNRLRIFLLLLLVLTPFSGAWAASSPWVQTEVGGIRLISAQNGVGEAERLAFGLEFSLKSDWKIYWRSPGDAGYPPKMDWKGSDNLAQMLVSWPAPERFTILGIETIGYKHEVVLPLEARLASPGQPLRLKLSLDVLACKDICIPVMAELALDLPKGPAGAALEAQRINQFTARVPGDGTGHGLSLIRAERLGDKTLIVEARADPPFEKPDLFVEGPEGFFFSAPKTTLEKRGQLARFEVGVVDAPKQGLAGAPLVITLADGKRGLEASLTPAEAQPAKPQMASLLGMIGLALLGGLILNLMPCVLPVLSLKIMSLIGHGGAERGQIRINFIASAMGILASFLILGLAAVGLKLTGNAVGWGLQFQEPLFLSFLATLVVLFAANMAGIFEIGIPHWLGGSGRALGHPHGLAQHFAAGMFATLLATPCSAPFLGTAVGFALAAGPLEILTVFLCLGLGMAGPYLAVAAWPQLAASLPRPGLWMVRLKQALSLALLATALWLLSVIEAQAGYFSALAVALLLLLTVAFLFLRQKLSIPAFGLAALLAALLAIPAPRLMPAPMPTTKASEAFWQPFDEAAIPGLVNGGKRVFVDVTADWCVTCQVNKRLVLNRDAVHALLTAPGTVAMKADWTKPNAAIGAYLAKFGRYGIPFNVVYGPGAPQGIALPELLSEEAVMAALKNASGH
ncbi:Cytochrome c-type biogenesis protein DsbD, protein-disulfide reductase [Rhodospirillaceae bacterium LM-1]|nr:Cytochrome c-type biogenesis protein DsbD, protein-disulfide reductase [Rhodospirillaceae bacterium LM-1]